MPQVPSEIIEYLGKVTKHIAQIMLKTLGAEGTNIFVANGPLAGQKAQHFMIHIIPRKENDKITSFNIPENIVDQNDLKQVFEKIKSNLNEKK